MVKKLFHFLAERIAVGLSVGFFASLHEETSPSGEVDSLLQYSLLKSSGQHCCVAGPPVPLAYRMGTILPVILSR